jgi:methylthioribose-1-phosphate isomerase
MELMTELRATPDSAIVWRDDRLYLLDQRALPQLEQYLPLTDATEVAAAIKEMVVRGAPAIGVTAAYGVALAARQRFRENPTRWRDAIEADLERLAHARPTAVNLFWAIARMRQCLTALPDGQDPTAAVLAEAQALHRADIAANRRLGAYGATLIEAPCAVITHCNAGALATGGYGTALGVIRAAYAQGRITQVFADETRPWLQGTRLTAWELQHDGIPVTLLADGAAASRMRGGAVAWVIVGADRIAANGDVANKIGTYALAVTARYHAVRVMVAAPTSTIDMCMASGADIPIEERDPAEVLQCAGRVIGPPGVPAWNPVFDLTPAALVDALVTEKGLVLSPDREKIAKLMAA